MKIFKENTTRINITPRFKSKLTIINKIKYLPSYSKEWKNIMYSFNKNSLKNVSVNTLNINKIIKSYFNLYFKDREFLGITRFVYLKKKRDFLKRIFISDANIKYTNNKAKITIFTINKEKEALKKIFHKLNIFIAYGMFNRYNLLYNKYIKNIYQILKNKRNLIPKEKKYFFARNYVARKNLVKYIIAKLNILLKLNNLILKKM